MKPLKHIFHQSRFLLVLTVFALSMVPRQVVHDFVTNHKHIGHADSPAKHQVSAETFLCKADTDYLQQFDDLTLSIDLPSVPLQVPAEKSFLPSSTLGTTFPDFNLRGPPAIS